MNEQSRVGGSWVVAAELDPPPLGSGLENATVRGRAWYKLLDALVQTLDVTV